MRFSLLTKFKRNFDDTNNDSDNISTLIDVLDFAKDFPVIRRACDLKSLHGSDQRRNVKRYVRKDSAIMNFPLSNYKRE